MCLMMDCDLLVSVIVIMVLFFVFSLFDLIVVGGGFVGYMVVIIVVEQGVWWVLVLEGIFEFFQKVCISGGGCCNVIYVCWDFCELVIYYFCGS